MKKFLLIYSLIFGLAYANYAQTTIKDDGLVTSSVPMITNSQFVNSFVQSFNNGLAMAIAKKFTTEEQVYNEYGYNLHNNPTLPAWSQTDNSPVSSKFLQSVIAVNNNIGVQYSTVNQMRLGLKDIARSSRLTANEATFLSALDISLQSMTSTFSINNNQGLAFYSMDKGIPSWLKCIFGTLGSALLGALSGALTGSAIPVVGTVAGAVAGFIGQGLIGAVNFC